MLTGAARGGAAVVLGGSRKLAAHYLARRSSPSSSSSRWWFGTVASQTPTVLAATTAAPHSTSTQHQQRAMSSSTTKAAASSGGSSEQQSAAASLQHMSVNELQELLANPVLCEEVQFVDVREQWEYDTARLPLFKLFPLSSASSWAATIEDDLDPDTETVVLCHHGVRSMQMAAFLVSKGFKTVKNVTGGIAAYSMIDRSVPEY